MTDIYVFRLQKQFHVLSCLPDMIVSFPESRSFVHRSSDKILHRPVTASRIYCILPYFFSLCFTALSELKPFLIMGKTNQSVYLSVSGIASHISPMLQSRYSQIRSSTDKATSSFLRSLVIVPVAILRSFLSVAGDISFQLV